MVLLPLTPCGLGEAAQPRWWLPLVRTNDSRVRSRSSRIYAVHRGNIGGNVCSTSREWTCISSPWNLKCAWNMVGHRCMGFGATKTWPCPCEMFFISTSDCEWLTWSSFSTNLYMYHCRSFTGAVHPRSSCQWIHRLDLWPLYGLGTRGTFTFRHRWVC